MAANSNFVVSLTQIINVGGADAEAQFLGILKGIPDVHLYFTDPLFRGEMYEVFPWFLTSGSEPSDTYEILIGILISFVEYLGSEPTVVSPQRKKFIYDVVKTIWDKNLEVFPMFPSFRLGCFNGLSDLIRLCLERKRDYYFEVEENSPILDVEDINVKSGLADAVFSYDRETCELLFNHGWSLDKKIICTNYGDDV
jgi:hypothetical protein